MKPAWTGDRRKNTQKKRVKTVRHHCAGGRACTRHNVVHSTRSTLEDKTEPPGVKNGILALDWHTLYTLEKECHKLEVVPDRYLRQLRLPG